jgi:hypothetical protein
MNEPSPSVQCGRQMRYILLSTWSVVKTLDKQTSIDLTSSSSPAPAAGASDSHSRISPCQLPIARSGVTVTQLLCFRYHTKCTEVPHAATCGRRFHLSFQNKMYRECCPYFAACGTPDRTQQCTFRKNPRSNRTINKMYRNYLACHKQSARKLPGNPARLVVMWADASHTVNPIYVAKERPVKGRGQIQSVTLPGICRGTSRGCGTRGAARFGSCPYPP